MVHKFVLIPVFKVFKKVENTNLVEVFSPAGDVALILFVTLGGETQIPQFLV
jgi:hypothetical protein